LKDDEMSDNGTIRAHTEVAAAVWRRGPREHIAIPEQVSDLDAVEEVMFFGYPDALYNPVNLTPILRRGSTATPLQLNYGGEPEFLIDASVFPGSSGSPVFIANFATYMNGRTGEVKVGGSRTMILGILSSSFLMDTLLWLTGCSRRSRA
jgi:hypothetical protein